MARRRGFYARDSHGRFARTGHVYSKKMSTKRKLAIAGAGAVAVGTAVGVSHSYGKRSGIRQGHRVGYERGFQAGKRNITNSLPQRDPKTGRMGRSINKQRRLDRAAYARGAKPPMTVRKQSPRARIINDNRSRRRNREQRLITGTKVNGSKAISRAKTAHSRYKRVRRYI